MNERLRAGFKKACLYMVSGTHTMYGGGDIPELREEQNKAAYDYLERSTPAKMKKFWKEEKKKENKRDK